MLDTGSRISGHPMELWRKKLWSEGFISSRDLRGVEKGEYVKWAGACAPPQTSY